MMRSKTMGANDIPLRAKLVRGKLVIEIGIKTLSWASVERNGGPLHGFEIKPKDEKQWSLDVIREIMREDETGNTPISEFFDSMIQKACDDGSIALTVATNKKDQP